MRRSQVVAAGTSLGEAVGDADAVVEQVAATGDTAGAAALVEGITETAKADASAAEVGGAAEEATTAAQGLEEQTAAAQVPPAVSDNQALLQQLTDQAVAELQANPSLAKGLMSPGSYAQLVNNTNLAAASFGKAVERQLAVLVENDPELFDIATHTGRSQGPNGQFISSPDFKVNEGGITTIYDVTTPGQVGAHVVRYGNQEVIFLTYTRPPGIIFQ